ncbi:hypothetical protein [Methylomonas albis]|nr:hypothetical protein [Methylomonas albis]
MFNYFKKPDFIMLWIDKKWNGWDKPMNHAADRKIFQYG